MFSFGQYVQQFEEPKNEGEKFDSLKIVVGGNFAMEFQGIKHKADTALIPLGNGIVLPTANFNINGYLAKGVKVNLETYLSARHHNEAWVKGGYLLINQMPFFESPLVDKLMEYMTLKVGVMELNYGDAHFRRSDNGKVTTNPFVGNYIMDAFTVSLGLEIMYRNPNGFFGMLAGTNGTVNPSIVGFNSTTKKYSPYIMGDEVAWYTKWGYDKKFNDDFRFRASLSGYFCENQHQGTLFSGDRAGSRYYLVMNKITKTSTDVDIKSNHTSGNWGPGTTNRLYAYQLNLFSKWKGLEFFGTYEYANNTLPSDITHKNYFYHQYAADLVYRFGKKEQFYGGARYNFVNNAKSLDMSIDRIQVAAGWYLNKYILAKVEYVTQKYNNFTDKYGSSAKFEGLIVEAAISF
ncbi:MAG TPA: hypothetical protein DEH02_07615 [Bacteroidales bacterium]|nr:hypothetical protein [Bacteroidales bacterium]